MVSGHSKAYIQLPEILDIHGAAFDEQQNGSLIANVPSGLIAPDPPSLAFEYFFDTSKRGVEPVKLGYVALPKDIYTLDVEERDTQPDSTALNLAELANAMDISIDQDTLPHIPVSRLHGFLHVISGYDSVLSAQADGEAVEATISQVSFEELFIQRVLDEQNSKDGRISDATRLVWLHQLWSLIGSHRNVTDLLGTSKKQPGDLGIGIGVGAQIRDWKQLHFKDWRINTTRGNDYLSLMPDTNLNLVASIGVQDPSTGTQPVDRDDVGRMIHNFPGNRIAHTVGITFLLERYKEGKAVDEIKVVQSLRYLIKSSQDVTMDGLAGAYDSNAHPLNPGDSGRKARRPRPVEDTPQRDVPVREIPENADTATEVRKILDALQTGDFVTGMSRDAAAVILQMHSSGHIRRNVFPDAEEEILETARNTIGQSAYSTRVGGSEVQKYT